jgi:hypothetical protein
MIHISCISCYSICQVDVTRVGWSDGLWKVHGKINPFRQVALEADRKSQGKLVECMQTVDNDRHLPERYMCYYGFV